MTPCLQRPYFAREFKKKIKRRQWPLRKDAKKAVIVYTSALVFIVLRASDS